MASYNPFKALTPKQIRNQARARTNAQYNPVIRNLNAQAASGQTAIQGYTNTLAAQLAGLAPQTQQIYANAQNEQRALDEQVYNRLQGAGQTASNELNAQFAQAGIPQANNTAAQTGSGAAGSQFAMGSAAMSALLSQGAAAQQYSAVLPGIARLGGLQQSQLLRGQTQSQLGDILSKEPGSYAQNLSDLQNLELQKATAVQSGLVDQAKLNQAAQKIQQGNVRLQQGQARLNLQAQGLSLKAQQDHISNLYKQAGLNIRQAQLGIAAKRERRLALTAQGKKGGFTPIQITKFQSQAIDTVKDWKHGYTNKQGQHIDPDPSGARGAFLYLTNHGIPVSIAANAVGKVYGKWLKKGQAKKLGIR